MLRIIETVMQPCMYPLILKKNACVTVLIKAEPIFRHSNASQTVIKNPAVRGTVVVRAVRYWYVHRHTQT